ncbi:MAG: hypothetical protein A2138_27930 [Deltaproteobacteria bacterium RBG_16_71_12]|nr:MAG: hypothetical protein A2138_27930 [Deltaproteobacteria bacterium RBG_16_71_12]
MIAGGALAAALVLWRWTPRAAAPPSITAVPVAEAPAEKKAIAADQAPPRAEKSLAEGAPPPEADAPPIVVERYGARRASCAGVCDLEARCGLRTFADCTAQSCEGEVRKLSNADFTLAGAADCASAAAAPCEEACWKRGECTGHHQADQQCTKACKRLVEQLPAETYRESRCVLERPCEELPLCAERR